MGRLLGRASAGMAAGIVGTVAMDLLRYRRYRSGGGDDAFTDWEVTKASSFDEAGPPALFARRVASMAGVDLPDSSAGTVANIMHWSTGGGYAALVQSVVDRHRNVAASGLATGAGAFLNSYAVLGAMGLYQPIWEYDRKTLLDDLTGHLVFGGTAAVAYRLLTWRST